MLSENHPSWDNLYKEYLAYCLGDDSDVDSWYPSNPQEITIVHKNGSRTLYDGTLHAVRTLRRAYNDRHCKDEGEWRRNFARNLSQRMRLRGFTQKDLSEDSGVSPMSISKYLNWKSTPSGYTIQRLADALGCFPDDLTQIRE